jgi:DNA-binding MarR family transcriptional regulator
LRKPKSGPERYLTFRLDVLSTGAMRIANDVYTARCGLGVRELRTLRLIDDNPGITFSDVTEETRFDRSLASRLLKVLFRDGLIERENSATDARVFHLRTTKAGRERRRVAAGIGQELETHLFKPLSGAQRTELLQSLEILTDWVYGDFAEGLDRKAAGSKSES